MSEILEQAVLDTRALLTTSRPSLLDKVAELVEVIQRLSMVRRLTDIQEIVRHAARHLTGADGATFVLREGGYCHYADEDAISPLWKGQRFPLESCVSGWVIRHHLPVVIQDVYADPRVPHAAYRPTFVKSLAMVPIRQLDPIGALGNYWAQTHLASGREVQLLQVLADSTAIGIESVRAYQALEEARSETLTRLALAAEYRDDDTFEHTTRVARLSALLAQELGLGERFVKVIRLAAPLHDLGKLAVPDAILLKPGRLTDREMDQVRTHARAGAAILSGSSSDVLRLAEEIALSHHEWWDGSGYPAGLRGDAIPLCGRIVTVADVFDALTHERPYKSAWPVHRAIREIREHAGRQFDPRIIRAFDALGQDVLADAVGV